MAIFDQLLQLRTLQNQRAEITISKERKLLLRSIEAFEHALQCVNNFEKFMVQREDEMYVEISNQALQVRTVEEFHHQTAKLYLQLRELKNSLAQLELARNQQQAVVAAAALELQKTTRKKEKSVESWERNLKKRSQIQEAAEEKDMDEAAQNGHESRRSPPFENPHVRFGKTEQNFDR